MDTADVERTLDAATAALHASFTERAAIRRYQSMGKTFEQLNGLYRGVPTETRLARRLIALAQTIDCLLDRSAVPIDLVVYRGLADLAAVVPPLDTLPRTALQAGYVSTTLHRDVAVRDFAADPAGRGGLLRVEVGPGTPGAWIAPLGDPALRYESELLLARGTFLDFRGRRVVDGVVEVDCEVVA